jgi:hypothetical protein
VLSFAMTLRTPAPVLVLQTIENLAEFHREHERFYAAAPREQAVVLERSARTLRGLADRWAGLPPPRPLVPGPAAGEQNPAARTAAGSDGVLYLPGPDEPAELHAIGRQLCAQGQEFLATAEWMSAAMQASWDAAPALLQIPELADLVGERHRIIANDWEAAAMDVVVGRLLVRAAEILDRIDLGAARVRADLAGPRVAPGLLHSTAELVSRAADLLSDSAGLVHDNERRWRVFHHRVERLLGSYPASPDGGR